MTEATPLASEQITQEDREAAADMMHPTTDLARRILEGRGDGLRLVQAFARHRIAALSVSPVSERITQPFQQQVQPWLMACFGEMIAGDREERNHRFLEEALELVQACGCTASEAHQLVDYVYGRPVGELHQEIGGVMVTLAALCLANDADMHAAGWVELHRIWGKVKQIRAKQAAKPKHSPLPEALSASPAPSGQGVSGERLALEAIKAVTATTKDAVAGLSRIMAITRSAGVTEPYSELMAKPEVALIVSEPRTEWRHLFEQPAGCTIPPAGWRCTRTPGHDGPCAAVPAAPAPSCAPGSDVPWWLGLAEGAAFDERMAARTASQCSAQETELAALLAEVELELRHCRVFIGSREKMHPTGIELYDQLHAKVNAALDALR